MRLSKPKIRRILKEGLVISTWLFLAGIIGILSLFIYLERTLPDPQTITSRQVKESTKIYDRTGKIVLYDIYNEEKRTITTWENIPESMRLATIAIEDNNFYSHIGFDIKGILRALVRNIERGYGEGGGGSTITQQLVGNALVGREFALIRKVRELMLSIEVERNFTKDQILWMYLNQVPYGSNTYGVESASQNYFGHSISQVSTAKAALLAALVQRPSYFSPYGSHVDELLSRKDFILHRMQELGFISQIEMESALLEKIVFLQPTTKLLAPHFVIMAQEYLIKKYGREMVESQGFKITTTLDSDLQNTAEKLVDKYAKINKDKYKATNAALVSIDPKNGEVLALIGSQNYFDTDQEGNFNVATAQRQPGSSFKPFAYAAAFQKGYPDNTVLFDLRTEFNPNCPPHAGSKKDQYGLDCYHPQNYDGSYRGPVTMRQSLAQSLNVTSVKTLYLAGIPETISLAQKMGITTLTEPTRYGLSLVLGGAEVKLIDIVSAYGVFANDGIRNPWSFIKKVELADGTILEEHIHNPERVIEPQVARLVSDILSDNNARAGVFGFNNPLYVPGYAVAAKTGTTQENRDAWVLGYSPSIAVGVWVGNNNNSSMTQAGAGISAAGPLWHDFMLSVLNKNTVEEFIKPDPIFSNKIMLNGEYRPQSDPAVPSVIHSILYYVEKNNPFSSMPANPETDSQFSNWEWAVRNNYGF